MGLLERKALYQQIETARDRHLIAVFLSMRGGVTAQMAPDILPWVFQQIEELPADNKGVDILIDSLGGDADVAIRCNDAFRELGRAINVIVPRSAFSAATMLALGASKIVMHPLACLGPIDPQLVVARPDGTREQVGAEDIKAFVQFVNEEVHLTDQAQVASVFARLCEDVRPVHLGVARRASMRSIAIAKELLGRHLPETDPRRLTIAERLAGGYHTHGHPISPKEAIAMGLPVEVATGDLAQKLATVIADVDDTLKTTQPVQPYTMVMDAWTKRRSRWEQDILALQQAQQAAGAQQVGTPLDAEVQSQKLSFEVPVTLEVKNTIGLVESIRAASACTATAHYIGSVSALGCKVLGGPVSAVWNSV